MIFDRIVLNRIYFKSSTEYYKKEQSGKKSNTVRIVNKEEDILIQESSITDIVIISVRTGNFFSRPLTDISRFKHDEDIIYIFSWNHES